MLRRILGYAVLALAGILVLKLVLGVFGFLMGLAVSLGVLAVGTYVCYLALRVISPGAAATVRELIRGPKRSSLPPGGTGRKR